FFSDPAPSESLKVLGPEVPPRRGDIDCSVEGLGCLLGARATLEQPPRNIYRLRESAPLDLDAYRCSQHTRRVPAGRVAVGHGGRVASEDERPAWVVGHQPTWCRPHYAAASLGVVEGIPRCSHPPGPKGAEARHTRCPLAVQ